MLKKIVCLLLAFMLAVPLTACDALLSKFSAEFPDLFDTITTLTGYAESEAEFDHYAEITYTRLKELHELFDIYNAYPGINNLHTVNENAGVAPVTVEPEIIELLLFAREGHDITGGAFNAALGPVLRIWHEYRAEGTALPPMDALREAAGLADMNDVIIDEENSTVFLQKPGMSLDVGAIAKAYAAGLAAKAAREAGLRSAILDAGGNIVTIGTPPDRGRDLWNIGIQNPDLSEDGTQTLLDTVRVGETSLSTSGGYQRYYTVDGVAYHHIIDPETLMPANRYKQVTVIHPHAWLADVLSLALFILPYEQGKAIAEEYDADALWIGLDGEWLMTDGYAEISVSQGVRP